MKNYREMYELKCCYYCVYYSIIGDRCKHLSAKPNDTVEPTGTCDNWREEEFGN